MSESTNKDSGAGRSVEENPNEQRSQSELTLVEWRSSDQVKTSAPSSSSPYLDIDDDDDFDLIFRFYKKETARGWNEFIELPKLHEGFIYDSDSLLIGVQIQVIRERVDRPFRCLDYEYRRELVTVFAPEVHLPLLWFVEEYRRELIKVTEDKLNWNCFGAFWLGLDQNSRRQLSWAKRDEVLKEVVKNFFHEQKITSAFVMEFLYSGLKALEGQTKDKKCRLGLTDTEVSPAPMVTVEKDMFVLADDVMSLIHRFCLEPFASKDELGHQTTRDGNARGVYNDETIQDVERRLIERGKKTMEVFALGHIYINTINMAYRDDLVWRRQEELIREEEEAKSKQKAAKEKKSKKKQAKQKKNKGKAEKRADTVRTQAEERLLEKEDSDPKNQHHSLEQAKPDTRDVVPKGKAVTSSSSSSPDIQLETVVPRVDIQKNASPKPETKDVVPKIKEVPSSSSSSPDSQLQTVVPRVDIQKTASPKPAAQPVQSMSTLVTVRKLLQKQAAPEKKLVWKPVSARLPSSSSGDIQFQTVVPIADIQKTASPNLTAPVSTPIIPPKKAAHVQSMSRPVSTPIIPPKQAAHVQSMSRPVSTPIIPPKQAAHVQSMSRPVSTPIIPPKQAAPVQSMSRPVNAPIIPPKQAAPVISAVQASTSSFARSMSSAGRLGSPPHSQTYIPQSYNHPIVGSSGFNHSSSQPMVTSTLPPYSHPPPISVSSQSSFPINVGSWDLSSCGLLWTGGSSSNRDTTTTTTAISGNHRTNPYNTPVTTNNIQVVTDECQGYGYGNNNQNSYLGNEDLGISGWSGGYSEETMPHFSFYSYWQMDELAQTQREMANMDMSSLAMRNQDDASSFSYFSLGSSSNPDFSSRINEYRNLGYGTE
ncbi:unnamed protein product [Microthlaspi erraticum]|uniref:MATH domain-containing protein n=1 Tax=Microthlaspi erraticum TaxID=1685480 RepID=A0A6D2KXX9_9BRAS|nr:unnamed protein product [Microthlaspi erraticum]